MSLPDDCHKKTRVSPRMMPCLQKRIKDPGSTLYFVDGLIVAVTGKCCKSSADLNSPSMSVHLCAPHGNLRISCKMEKMSRLNTGLKVFMFINGILFTLTVHEDVWERRWICCSETKGLICMYSTVAFSLSTAGLVAARPLFTISLLLVAQHLQHCQKHMQQLHLRSPSPLQQ